MLTPIKKAAGGLRTTTATTTHNAIDFIASGERQASAGSSLAALVSDINHHHQLACLRADEAVNHAVQAGKLLLGVKATLPHGQFGDWLQSNLEVTPRHARRYMAAAQGKPVPIRTIASKRTPVSVLEVNEGEAIHIERVLGNWQDLVMVFPHADAPGFFHYAFITGEVGEDGSCSYTKHGVNAKAISAMVNRDLSMPELKELGIERFTHPGCSKNPFATKNFVSALDTVKPVFHPDLEFARELVEQFIADNDIDAANMEIVKLLDGGDEYEVLALPGDSLDTIKANLKRVIAQASEPVPLTGKKENHRPAQQRKKIVMLARTVFKLLATPAGSAA